MNDSPTRETVLSRRIASVRLAWNEWRVAPKDSPEHVLERLNFLASLEKATKDIKSALHEQVIEWLDEHDGRLDVPGGTAYYYAGVRKTTKCVRMPAAIEAIMEAVGGDFDQLVATLSKNAIKPAAARNVLGQEKWEEYFDEEKKPVLLEGKDQRKLLHSDTKFERKE